MLHERCVRIDNEMSHGFDRRTNEAHQSIRTFIGENEANTSPSVELMAFSIVSSNSYSTVGSHRGN